jgi:membrane protein implicated in regulation of membrane protease activity
MPIALSWLIFALALAVAEALTGDMFLLMLGGGALAASATAWLTNWPILADGAVFLIVSVLLVVVVRPVVRRQLTPRAVRTGIHALEGKEAVVLHRIAGSQGGRIKLDGQVWTARPMDKADVYEPGDSVTVLRIDGATAVVFGNV